MRCACAEIPTQINSEAAYWKTSKIVYNLYSGVVIQQTEELILSSKTFVLETIGIDLNYLI